MSGEDTALLIDAHLIRWPTDTAVDWLITLTEDTDSVRGPGWYIGECLWCDWSTSGSEPVVEDAAYDHVADIHARFVDYLLRRLAMAIRMQKRPAGGSGDEPERREG